jgi:hypothetical protein
MINKQDEETLLLILDTLDKDVWVTRMTKAVGSVDQAAVAVQTICMLLAQMRNTNMLNDDSDLQKSRLDLIETYAKYLPKAYQYKKPGTGCQGCDSVTDVEVDFAVETVLAALIDHHDCVPRHTLSKLMRGEWHRSTLPALTEAVRGVLETRNAHNF